MGPRKRKCSNLVQVVKEEDDEFHYDVRLARRWKRRCIANQKFKLNSKGDNSTGRCCKELKEVPDCNYIQIDSDNGDDDGSAVYISPPDSAITFTKTVGHNGNATAADNGRANVAFAENVDAVDQSPIITLFGAGTLENNNCMDARSTGNCIIGGSLENGIIGDDVTDNGHNVTATSVDHGEDNDGENTEHNYSFDVVDPEYKMFWENLKEDGESYFLEVPVIDGVSEIVSYESEGQCDGCMIGDSKRGRHFPERECLNNERVLRSASETMVMNNDTNEGCDLLDVDCLKRFGQFVNAPSNILKNEHVTNDRPKEGELIDVHPKNLVEPDKTMKSPLEINHGQTDDHKKEGEHMVFDCWKLFNGSTPGFNVNEHDNHAVFVDDDVVIGSVENDDCNDACVGEGNRNGSPVQAGDMGTRSLDDSAVSVSPADGSITGAENVGQNGFVTATDIDTVDVAFAENVDAVDQSPNDVLFGAGILENDGGMGAMSRDFCAIDGSLENGIVHDDVDNGNNVNDRSVDGNDDNDTKNAEHKDFFDDVDPDYKFFLENLKEDGKSYFLEIPVVDGILEIIRYESEDEKWDGCITENLKKTRDFPERESLNNKRVLRSASKRRGMESHSNLRDGMETQGNLRDIVCTERKSSMVERTVKKKVAGGIFCTHNGCSSNKPSSKTLSSTKCCEKNFNMVDESYEMFLNSVKIEGRHIVFLPESGGKLTYEEDEQSSSDSEVIELDVDSFSGGVKSPFVTSKDSVEEDGDGFLKSSGRNNCSQYRERLMEILQRPFDKREHQNLLNKVSCKRELLGERETRSGKRREYPTGIMGKSYLEQHCDLAEKILLVKTDPAKELNILRGFFYWLQNVAHKGVFQPWRDSSCLEVLPQ